MAARLLIAAVLVLWFGAVMPGADANAIEPAETGWRGPSGAPLDQTAALDMLALRRIVLLGENHTDPDHHRWQLHTIAALHGRDEGIVLGFEAFPRAVQPILDAWVGGQLGEHAFLERARWSEVWGFDPQLYLPLFEFARIHRVPMVALNVERSLTRTVAREGWSRVPPDERQGIGQPAPPLAAYRASLFEVFSAHREDAPPVGEEDPGFARFVEAQQVWDRAMAEAIAGAVAGGRRRLIGIIGSGHLEHGYGVPYQLAALGLGDVAVALPTAGPPPPADGDGRPAADLFFELPRSPDEAPSR